MKTYWLPSDISLYLSRQSAIAFAFILAASSVVNGVWLYEINITYLFILTFN